MRTPGPLPDDTPAVAQPPSADEIAATQRTTPLPLRVLRHLPVLALGRPLRGRARYDPFLIVGAPRSGTTVLRAILQAHPAIHIPPETLALTGVVRAWRWYSRCLSWQDLLRVVLARFEYHAWWEMVDLPLAPVFASLAGRPAADRNLAAVLDALFRAHAARHKPTATRWGEKTPGNVFALRSLRTVFPDLRVVHLLRDGRDVVASHMRRAPYPLPLAARRWIDAVDAAQRFGSRYPGRYLEVRYEDLLSEPRIVLEGVTAFLGLEFDAAVLRHHEADLAMPDVDRIPLLRYVREPLHRSAVGGWRHYFDGAQAAELHGLLGRMLERLGYGER